MIMDCWGGAKIRCEFSKTQINTDNIVLKTIFHNVPDSTLYVKPETIRKENTLIQGKNGEELVLTKKGQVMGKTEFNATGGNSVLLKEYHRKSDSLAQWQINFSKYDAQTYAFDYLDSGNHGIFATDEYYPTSGKYAFRYKSVECGKSDKVIVDFGSYPEKDSVIFKDKYGVKLKVVDGNILSFTGVSKADTNFIYAYRGDKKIGKLFLNTYQQKIYKVVLISVNEAKLPNLTDLENDLNKVYNQCAVSFKIETRKLQVTGIDNFTHGGTKVAGSVWNASQKVVLEAFGEKYEDNTAYLFFIPKAETGGVAGYMPRYYPYGFIYPGAANRTIAHELGHGIAGLEHPFPESQVSGSTQNLMDYRDGTELWHFQWDMLQDPSRKIFKWWQNEQDAESIRIDDLVEAYDTARAASKWPPEFHYVADKRIACFTPAGRPIVLPKNIKTMSFLSIFEDVPQGALTSFTTETEIYVAYYRMEENKRYFKGYVQVVGTNPKDLTTYIKYKDGSTIPDYYVDDITKGLSESDLITYGYNTLCGVNIAQVVYSAVSEADRTEIKHTSDYTGSGYCQKRLPDFAKYMGYNTEFKVKDPTNCLKTQAAIEFYNSQIEALSKSLDNGYDIKKEAVIIRIALKIEEISTSNSEMSKLFDTYHNNTEQAFGTPILWNSEQKLLVLEEFLNNLFDIQKLRKQLLECKDALVLYDLLCAFRCVHNDYMDFDIIWHNIDVLCNSSAFKYDFDDIEPNVHVKMQDAISYKIRREQYLLKFIEDVTPDYYGVLLNNIFNQQVFEKFSNHLEVESYAYFVSTLFEYWVSEYKSDLAQSLLQYYQGISSDSNPPESGTYPYTFLVWHRSLFQPGTNIAYSSYWLNGKVKINQYEGFRLFASHTIIEQLVDPYKTVIIVFETVPSFLSGQIEQGQTVAMPAFFFNWIATTQDEQDFRNGITIATTLLTLGLSVKDLIGAGANLFKAGLSRTTIWALSKSTISFGCNAYGTMMLSEDFVTWLKDKHPNIETSLTWLALGWGAYGIGSSESKLLKFRKAEQEMKNIRFAQIKKEIIGEINKTKDVKTLQAVKTFNNKTNKYGYNNLDDFVSELKTLNTELKDYKRQSENVQKIADNATYTPTVRYATIEDNLLSDLKKYEDELVEYQSKIVEPITEIRFHYNELSYAFKQGYNRLSTNEEKRYYEELKNILDQIKIDFLIEDENK